MNGLTVSAATLDRIASAMQAIGGHLQGSGRVAARIRAVQTDEQLRRIAASIYGQLAPVPGMQYGGELGGAECGMHVYDAIHAALSGDEAAMGGALDLVSSELAEVPVDRGGRRPRDPENRRTVAMTTKVSERERGACEAAAQREGVSLSEWQRNTLLLRAYPSG